MYPDCSVILHSIKTGLWSAWGTLGHKTLPTSKKVKQNEKGIQTATSEALNQPVLASFLNVIAMRLLKQKDCIESEQKDCIELVQVENWFFDQKKKSRGRGELCGKDSFKFF